MVFFPLELEKFSLPVFKLPPSVRYIFIPYLSLNTLLAGVLIDPAVSCDRACTDSSKLVAAISMVPFTMFMGAVLLSSYICSLNKLPYDDDHSVSGLNASKIGLRGTGVIRSASASAATAASATVISTTSASGSSI